jgi:hypothetical protein
VQAQWASWGEMGQMANGPVKKKRNNIWISKLISMFWKIDFGESGGRNNWEKFLENCMKIRDARMWTWVNFWSTQFEEVISRVQGNFIKCQYVMLGHAT